MALATAIAIGGLAISGASAGMSFAQAGAQKRRQRQAEADAAIAMAAARKKLEINYADELAIQKEPYELQREALLSAGAQAIEAGVESERGAAATAGKVQMAQNEAQADVRTAMGKEMMDIQKQQIAEQSRLRDLNVQLDLGEVEGAQLAARDAQEAATASMEQGFQGLTSMAQQGLDMIPLYQKTAGVRQTQKLSEAARKANPNITQEQFQAQVKGLSTNPEFGYLSGLGGKDVDFNAFMSGLSRSQVRDIGKAFNYEGYVPSQTNKFLNSKNRI